MAGHSSLLAKIKQLIEKSYQRIVNPDTELLVTTGATQGIFTTLLALLNTDEEVLILDPSYDCYEAPILLSKAKPIHYKN
jgi:methionine aminotransferase